MATKIISTLAVFWLIMLSFHTAKAQKYDNYWTFGDSAGIDFTDVNNPKYLNTYKKTNNSSAENQATLSSPSGRLICYLSTSTNTFYNKFNKAIVNGKGIQTYPILKSILIPFPSDTTQYYFITFSDWCDSIACNIRYSIIQDHMNYDSIKITSKNNILLKGGFSGQIAGIQHANGKDWWIITHESTSNKFVRFLITDKGFEGPYYQAIGRGPTKEQKQNGNFYWRSGFSFSPKGNYIASSAGGIDLFELFKFDRCKGTLSDCIVLGQSNMIDNKMRTIDYLNCCFSPDETKLYVKKIDYRVPFEQGVDVLQFNLINNFVVKSFYDVEKPSLLSNTGAFELGQDNKIYIAQNSKNYLSVIEKPNEVFPACNFKLKGFELPQGRSSYGLPQFPVWRVPPYNQVPAVHKDTSICKGDSLVIGFPEPRDGLKYFWYPFDGIGTFDQSFMTVCPQQSESVYTLVVSDPKIFGECGKSYSTFIVKWLTKPKATRIDTQLCQRDTLQIGKKIPACKNCRYRWSPSDGILNPDSATAIIKTNKNMRYVRYSYQNQNCLIQLDSVLIESLPNAVPPCTSASVDEYLGSKVGIIISPNPASDAVTVNYVVPIDECATLEVYSANGAKVYSSKFKGEKGQSLIDTKNWAAGVYLFRFNCNGIIKTQRLVISR